MEILVLFLQLHNQTACIYRGSRYEDIQVKLSLVESSRKSEYTQLHLRVIRFK